MNKEKENFHHFIQLSIWSNVDEYGESEKSSISIPATLIKVNE